MGIAEGIFNKILEFFVFILVLIRAAIGIPLMLVASGFSYLGGVVADFFCNMESPDFKLGPQVKVPEFARDFVDKYVTLLKYSKTDQDSSLNFKVLGAIFVLVVGVIISLVLIYSKPKEGSNEVHVPSTTTWNSIGLTVLFLLLFGGLILLLYSLNKRQIIQEQANVALGTLNANFSYGSQTFADSSWSFLQNWGGVVGAMVFTIFMIFLFGSILPSEKVNQETFKDASYVIGLILAVLITLFINRTFGSSKLAILLGAALFAFVGYMIYYAYKNPTQGLFSFENFITAVGIFSSLLVFYLVFKSNHDSGEFNITYERIKMLVLFFCFIALTIIFKTSAPGDIVKKYFGHLFALTITLAVFILLYLIVLTITPTVGDSSVQGTRNLLDVLNSKTWWFFGFFLLFLIIVTFGFSFLTEDIKKNQNFGWAVTIVLITSILFGFMIFWPKVPQFSSNFVDISDTMTSYKALLGALGLTISGLLVYWIYSFSMGLKKDKGESITQSISNLILILIVLTFVYKILIIEFPALTTGWISVILDLIFYIPCLISKAIDGIMAAYFGSEKGTIPLLIFCILFFWLYAKLPDYSMKILVGGGKVLQEDSISLREEKILAAYSDLNPLNKFSYRYAISLWAFIDAMPPNTNENYNKYCSILSYGGKPDLLYNPSLNTALVTMKLTDVDETKYDILDLSGTVYEDTYLLENERMVIVKKIENLPLQKWNNFVLNCDGGTIDVFLNNELIASKIEMVPYMTYDSIVTGQQNGLYGGVNKVVYHDTPMTQSQIYYAYNSIVHAIKIPE
jgi:hypothetical protein